MGIDAGRAATALPLFRPLQAPLTSTDWDGDGYSTTAKTPIDLSAVFGAPAGMKAVYVKTIIRDSGSAANDPFLVLGPTNGAGVGPETRADRVPNDILKYDTMIVPCDANGDIYYQIGASGAGTMDVWIQIWGYWL